MSKSQSTTRLEPYRDVGILLDVEIRMRLDDLLDGRLGIGFLADERHIEAG